MYHMKVQVYMMRCAIWYHLQNLKNVKNTHGGMLLLVKLQAEASPFFRVKRSSYPKELVFKFTIQTLIGLVLEINIMSDAGWINFGVPFLQA